MYKLTGLVLLNILFNLAMVWLFWRLRFRQRLSAHRIAGVSSSHEIIKVAEDLREVSSQVRHLEERLVERYGQI